MTDLSLAHAAADPAVGPRPALVDGGVVYSFADLGARAASLRVALAHEGVAAGTRVALSAKNSVDTVLAILALLDLGAAVVPIHPRLTSSEADVLLADAAPALTLRDGDLPVPGRSAAPPPPPLPSSLPLALLYTSGTTGRPKGAVLSRAAFVAAATASALNLGWREDDRWLLAMPVCHVGGLSILTRCLLARRTVILEPRFDPDAVLAAVVRERATLLSVVPTMLQALLERDREGALGRLRAILVGGAGAPFGLLQTCEQRGVLALTTYGLTEACSQVTVQRLASPYRAAPGSGEPLSGVELRVAGTGEIGRLQVRGPTLMDGYFRGPGQALDPARDPDGWFDTGDLGELDARGALHVHARRSDLIVTGGENVYPVEVEQRLEALPGVRRALVFGVPDERWGHVVAAALELDAGFGGGPDAALSSLAEPVAAALAPHKRPRLACVVEALSLTASGKLERGGAAARHGAALRPLAVRR